MDFDDIIKRESNSDDFNKQLKVVQEKFDLLYESFYSETKLNNLKERIKQKLLNEFEEYFKALGFSVKANKSSNKFFGEFEIRTATLGRYTVEISISTSFAIFLEIQHKKDYGTEEYRMSMELSSESEFESCIINKHGYSQSDMIELIKKDMISLNKIIKENKPVEIVCRFDDGQNLDMFKEYKSFDNVIKDIPDK